MILGLTSKDIADIVSALIIAAPGFWSVYRIGKTDVAIKKVAENVGEVHKAINGALEAERKTVAYDKIVAKVEADKREAAAALAIKKDSK